MARATSLAAAAVAALLLAGCEHDRYVDRRDQVTFGSGDAVAANKAMHIIDPWPRAARTVDHGMSGEAAEAALEKLRKRTRGLDAPPPPATLTLTPAPAAPSP
jgi:hypothetical protein